MNWFWKNGNKHVVKSSEEVLGPLECTICDLFSTFGITDSHALCNLIQHIVTTHGQGTPMIFQNQFNDSTPPRCAQHKCLMVLGMYYRPGSPMGNGWYCPQCSAERNGDRS